MADIRDLLRDVERTIIGRLDAWGEALWQEIQAVTNPPTPTRIIQTSAKGSIVTTTPPSQPVALAQGQTDTIAITLADASGTVIAGAVLDPGATVTVSDGSALSAALSLDQTSVLVTALPGGGQNVSVQVNGSFNGVALGVDPTLYDVAADVPTQIVQTPGPVT
jgi:hypothetical protein